MKNTITIIILFSLSYINTFSQKFEAIKKLDTIYIEYKGENSTIRIIENSNKNGFVNRLYRFSCLVKKKISPNIFVEFREYKNSEKKLLNQKSEFKVVNKVFLKKHKNSIINSSFFLKLESCALDNKILSINKVYYLIDYLDSKKNKILLYEVSAGVFCNNED